MKFYVNYIYKGNYEKEAPFYESYILVPTDKEVMSKDDIDNIRDLIVDYMKDLFNLEDDDILIDDVIIRNWNLIYG